jgi:hypothetical protein
LSRFLVGPAGHGESFGRGRDNGLLLETEVSLGMSDATYRRRIGSGAQHDQRAQAKSKSHRISSASTGCSSNANAACHAEFGRSMLPKMRTIFHESGNDPPSDALAVRGRRYPAGLPGASLAAR